MNEAINTGPAKQVDNLKKVKMTPIRMAGMLFCLTAAGAFGIEDMIPLSGPGFTLVMLVIFAVIWAYPISQIVSELSAIMPAEGGIYIWVKEALGEFWGFCTSWWGIMNCYLGLSVYIVLITDYASKFVPALQDYTMIIVAVMFLAAGVTSCLVSGMSGSMLAKTSWEGIRSILPAVAMILMASSIKYTLEEAKILDTILHEAVLLAETIPRWTVILFIYLIVLIMNFFIPSGSAKAFMLIPLIVPMAQIFGISTQLCVVAFAFGDGFSNVFYPTNPALLISLGLAGVSYGDWFRWSWKFQGLNLVLTGCLLLFGLAVGY